MCVLEALPVLVTMMLRDFENHTKQYQERVVPLSGFVFLGGFLGLYDPADRSELIVTLFILFYPPPPLVYLSPREALAGPSKSARASCLFDGIAR